MKLIWCSLVVFSGFLTATDSLHASGCPPKPASADEPAESLTIYLDPVTGEITDPPPTDPDTVQQAEAPQQATPPDEVQQTVLPDGSVRADVGDRFVTELHAELVDGKLVTCHRPASQSADQTQPERADSKAGKDE